MVVENMGKRFWRLKEERKVKNLDKQVNSLTGTKLVVRRRRTVFFLIIFVFLAIELRAPLSKAHFFWQIPENSRQGAESFLKGAEKNL